MDVAWYWYVAGAWLLAYAVRLWLKVRRLRTFLAYTVADRLLFHHWEDHHAVAAIEDSLGCTHREALEIFNDAMEKFPGVRACITRT